MRDSNAPTMARLNTRPESSDVEHIQDSSSTRARQTATPDTPQSDIDQSYSDKENRGSSRSKTRPQKRKSDALPMSEQEETSASTNKRRRTDQKPKTQPGRVAFQKELDTRLEKKFYDPDQNEHEKRATRKSLRELAARVNDSKSEYLKSGSTGIEDTLKEADKIYRNVKQTSVATIDSRLLVAVGDLAYKKVNTLTLGDTSIGIDVDDFVTKCISFMKKGSEGNGDEPAGTQPTSSQRRRRRYGDADEDEDGEPMDWSYLGRNACVFYNSRPCLSGFLLGPLSVQKKVRQQTQRRAKEARADPSQATRPLQLGVEDLEKQESANLTVICSEIAHLLDKTITKGSQQVEEEFDSIGEDLDEDQIRALMLKHNVTDNGCVPLFNFCVNPRSFGQTVENLFYVSFLIKEGKVGLDFDSKGLPTLGTVEARSVEERQETQRNQAVFTLDFDIWQELVESFGIQKSIIPHRKDEMWDDGTLSASASSSSLVADGSGSRSNDPVQSSESVDEDEDGD